MCNYHPMQLRRLTNAGNVPGCFRKRRADRGPNQKAQWRYLDCQALRRWCKKALMRQATRHENGVLREEIKQLSKERADVTYDDVDAKVEEIALWASKRVREVLKLSIAERHELRRTLEPVAKLIYALDKAGEIFQNVSASAPVTKFK